MSTRCEGDFTTNSSVVDQISKRQDVCLSFFKNPTTHGLSLHESHIETTFLFFNDFYDKIASEGEGRKPSSDRQKYIVESEFALLGILSKQCLMIHFYLGSSGQHGCKLEIINV